MDIPSIEDENNVSEGRNADRSSPRSFDSSVAVDQQWTRRALLRAGIGVAGVAATAGVTAGKQDNTIKAVIPEQQQYGQTVTGFFIHLGEEIDPIEASVDDECDFVSWSNDETLAYDAKLIDRKADPEEAQITLYLHQRVEVTEGMLFIINNIQQCESGYLGINIVQIGANLAQIRARDFTPNGDPDANANGGTDANGPGFGIIGALAGIAGMGWLRLRSRDE